MELSVRERLILLNSLPQHGNMADLKVIRKLQESLSFSEDEHKKFKFAQDGETVRWDDNVEQGAEIEIGEKANDIIVKALADLNKQNKLTIDHLDLYEKFVKGD